MKYINYARLVLGNDKVNELIKQFNLNTKKWTIGRSKSFFNKLKKEVKQELNKQVEEKVDEFLGA